MLKKLLLVIFILFSCSDESNNFVSEPVEPIVPIDTIVPVDTIDPVEPVEPSEDFIFYGLSWNYGDSISCNIHELNITNGTSTIIGVSSLIESQSNLKKFYLIDNNTVVGLHNGKDIWKLNLSTGIDELVPLDTIYLVDEPYFSEIYVNNGFGYILYWDKTFPFIYEVKGVDLDTGELLYLGESSLGVMDTRFDLNEIYYINDINTVIGLHDRKNIWKLDLSTGIDELIPLDLSGDPLIKDLYVKDGFVYILYWDRTLPFVYEVKGVDLETGELTDLAESSLIESQFDLNEIYYSDGYIISLFNNTDIWVYDFFIDGDYIIDIDDNFYNDIYVD